MKYVIGFFVIGVLIGFVVAAKGWYLAIKSKCTDLNAIIFSFVGAAIVTAVSAITSTLLNHVAP